MRNRLSTFVVFVALCVAAALVPVACGSDSSDATDGPVDRTNTMTAG